jgi:N-acetylmuramoyl-L-alanine amidase
MFKMKYTIEKDYIPAKTKRRSGIEMPHVGFVTVHDTGNDGSTAAGNVNYYKDSANTLSASAHTFIDDERIIECIPATTGKPEKAWHVLYDRPEDNKLFGDDANDIAIGVELCYSYKKGSIDNKEAYKRYVWYVAYLCYKFGLDPRRNIVGHNELDPERKLDPFKNALKIMGISKAQFIQDVVNELADCTREETATPKSPVVPKPIEESEDDEPMKLAQWEKDLLIEGVKKYNKVIGNDGHPVINSPDYWIAKINNDSITAGEIAILSFAILSRTVK